MNQQDYADFLSWKAGRGRADAAEETVAPPQPQPVECGPSHAGADPVTPVAPTSLHHGLSIETTDK